MSQDSQVSGMLCGCRLVPVGNGAGQTDNVIYRADWGQLKNVLIGFQKYIWHIQYLTMVTSMNTISPISSNFIITFIIIVHDSWLSKYQTLNIKYKLHYSYNQMHHHPRNQITRFQLPMYLFGDGFKGWFIHLPLARGATTPPATCSFPEPTELKAMPGWIPLQNSFPFLFPLVQIKILSFWLKINKNITAHAPLSVDVLPVSQVSHHVCWVSLSHHVLWYVFTASIFIFKRRL